jgi:outer membrane lipoprotein-sorting protein
MKTLKLLVLMLTMTVAAQAQTVDEILNKYFENTGGKEKWAALNSVKMNGKVKVQGMEIPMNIIQTADGKQKIVINFQGKEITQMAFDGNEGWSTNFMTQKPEKMDAEASANMKSQTGDFPDPFLNYKEKGYTAQLEGKETIEGTETYKIKLTKKPVKVDGKDEENVVYYFFDAENYVPIAMKMTVKSGQMKGATVETMMSDYQESNGLYFPFSVTTKYNGQTGEAIQIESIDQNVQVDAKTFAFPEGK